MPGSGASVEEVDPDLKSSETRSPNESFLPWVVSVECCGQNHVNADSSHTLASLKAGTSLPTQCKMAPSVGSELCG